MIIWYPIEQSENDLLYVLRESSLSTNYYYYYFFLALL